MWKSLAHNEKYGPKAAAYRNEGEKPSVDMEQQDEVVASQV